MMPAAPALPLSHASQAHEDQYEHDAPAPRRRCGGRACSKLAASPTRGMAIIMSLAATAALIIAMLQLAGGEGGREAATTLYVAAGFNLLFTALYAPLVALFTLRTGFFRGVGALLRTAAMGVAYTLGLLFVTAVLLVALSSIFG